jgi:hypothetical protein
VAFKVLERYAGKLARTVLRGVGAGNSPRLPDYLVDVCDYLNSPRVISNECERSYPVN